jgi:hypothetical protein
VTITSITATGTTAMVQGDHASYVVASRHGRWQCNCAYVRAGCSHQLAVRLVTDS